VNGLGLVAIRCAERGWPVFPLEPGGKRPNGKLVPHGLKDATLDPEVIERWWRVAPESNIGLPTGIAFDVLDIDSDEALEALNWAMPQGDDPATNPVIIGPTGKTPRGWHAFVAPTGFGNTVDVGGISGIDWRGKGGYIVAPGSTRSDGVPWYW
jgi:hypothetical protein